MFEKSERIGAATEAIYEIAETLERGQVLTHEAIRRVLDVPPHTGPWGHVLNRVRRRLERDRGIATWPETGVGYKLLSASEQLELPLVRGLRGLRQLRRGRRSVVALPETALTAHQRRTRAFLAERALASERELRAGLKAQRRGLLPAATLPRRPAPGGTP